MRCELADSEKKCPLCGTVVFNPEVSRPNGESPYPKENGINPENVNRSGIMFIITMLFLLPIVTVFLVDWQVNGKIIWSGYAAGAVLLLYILVVLPLWFKSPNPVIFIPSDFAALALSKIETDMAGGDMIRYTLNTGKIRFYDRISDRIPIDGSFTSQSDGNGYYAVPDFEINNAHLQESIYQGIHNSGE